MMSRERTSSPPLRRRVRLLRAAVAARLVQTSGGQERRELSAKHTATAFTVAVSRTAGSAKTWAMS